MISKFIMISERRNFIISVSVKDQKRNEIKKRKKLDDWTEFLLKLKTEKK